MQKIEALPLEPDARPDDTRRSVPPIRPAVVAAEPRAVADDVAAPLPMPLPLPPAAVHSAIERVIEQLDVELAAVPRPVVSVVPTAPGEGSTTMAWWLLSLLAARRGAPVLFVDASTDENQHVAESPAARLVAVDGSNAVDLLRWVQPSAVANISLLRLRSARARVLQPAELKQALGSLREHFSWIVIDSVPPSNSPMALFLAQQSDACLLLLASGVSDRRQAQATLDLLHRGGARVVGALLNKARG